MGMKKKLTISVKQLLTMVLILGIIISVSQVQAQTKTKVTTPTKTKTVPVKTDKKPTKEKLTNPTATRDGKKPQKPVAVVKDSITLGTGESAITIPVEPVVDNLPKGKVDWTNQYIEAKGQSVIDTGRFKNLAQARLMAKRGAIVDAQRNLLEITKGVQVTSETKVQDMITTSDYIYSRVDGVIKNAQQVGEAIEKDGYIEVTMRIPLYDQKGLAPVLYDQVVKKMNTFGTTNPIKTITPADVATTDNQDATPETEITDMSNLVLNFNGKKYDPSMFPVVMDENNNLLLDYSKIYDPKKGKFPKIVSAGKSLLEAFGIKKGVEVLNVIESADGKIKIDTSKVKNKINWAKIGNIAATVGKVALAFVL